MRQNLVDKAIVCQERFRFPRRKRPQSQDRQTPHGPWRFTGNMIVAAAQRCFAPQAGFFGFMLTPQSIW